MSHSEPNAKPASIPKTNLFAMLPVLRAKVTGAPSLRLLALLILTTAALFATTASASASLTHNFLTTFNGSDAPAPLAGPQGLAIDNSAGANRGDVYVSDLSKHVIDRFNAAGQYICQITGAGSETTSPSECGPTGTPTVAKSLDSSGLKLAIDQSNGSLY
ncbi:MAG: hypothetical protein JWM24_2174, partial [Solirubrobacterales bacterium]|nr:hypothetical protein [Solirubrobacterales bacterium]